MNHSEITELALEATEKMVEATRAMNTYRLNCNDGWLESEDDSIRTAGIAFVIALQNLKSELYE